MSGNAVDGREDAGDEDLTTTAITDFAALHDTRHAWNRLVEKGARSSVFLRYEWIDAAWAWLGESHDPYVVFCHRARGGDTGLAAVAPLCRSTESRYRMPYRELSLIDVPDTQECDVVVEAGGGADMVAAILDHLVRNDIWDVLRLPKLQPDSVLARHVAEECRRRGLRYSEQPAGENYEVDISGGWESYYATRSRRLKKGNNNIRNRIKGQAGDVAIRWSRGREDVESDLPGLLSEFKRISAVSWKKETGLTLDRSGPGRFIDRLTEHALEHDWLSLWALSFDGRVVATEYQLAYGQVVSALRADFDQERSELSPGSYLNWQLLQRLCDEDLLFYRMGPGSNPYKLRWSNRTTPLTEIRVYNRTRAGRYHWTLETRVIPPLRRARRFVRGLFANADDGEGGPT